MTTTARRGWLIAALSVAVAVLLGSVLAVVAWSGSSDQAATRSRPESGMSQFWRGAGTGPGMMGEDSRRESRAERRADCLELRAERRDG